MKRKYNLFLLLLMILPLFIFGNINNNPKVVNADYLQPDVTTNLSAYGNLSNYYGSKTSTTLKASDILDVNIIDKGGVHEDGNGKAVFSNYVVVTINYKFDSNHKVLDKDTYILSNRDMNVPGKVYGRDEKVKLETKVGYGQLFVSNAAYDGERREYTNIGIQGGTTQRIHLTDDGNYYFVSVFDIKENGQKKKIVLETIIPVRTSIYLTDLSGVYQVKNNGKYFAPFIVDANKRDNVEIYCNNKHIQDGTTIRDDGTYLFKVYGNGYFCEQFTFEKYENLEIAELYISNIRKKIGDNCYEAENHFIATWKENVALESFITNLNSNVRMPYMQGTKIEEAGFYKIELKNRFYGQTMTTYVNLIESDAPNHNYNMLSGYRFNNFKTKWYEVYDQENDDYLCFDLDEYSTAFSAALTIENKKVEDKGIEKIYLGQSYTDSITLTKALNENAEKNIKIQYYDFENSTKSKLFSTGLFEETIYLNSDFIFVKSHPSETNTVILINEENNKEYNIEYFKSIKDHNLPSGKYLIKELDAYGNENSYYGIIDKDAPRLTLNLNGEVKDIKNGDVLEVDYFLVDALIDSLDSYAVLSINENFYINREYYKEVFNQNGTYNIRAYDRNNNFIKCTIIIDKEALYTLNEDEEHFNIILEKDVSIIKAYKNDNEITLNSLSIKKETNEKEEYIIYLKNNVNNHLDCLKIETTIKKQNNIIDEENPNDKTNNGWIIALLVSIIVLTGFTVPGTILLIKSKKEEH